MSLRVYLVSIVVVVLGISALAPHSSFVTAGGNEDEQRVATHFLYTIIPRHRSCIAWYDVGRWTLWALFGNDDDGIFGERAGFHPELRPGACKAALWTLRNPLHNICFYVIGSAGSANSAWKLLEVTSDGMKVLDYQPQADMVFAGKHSFLLALHGGKPFCSFCWEWSPHHQSKFYFGWRCRGNFGIKCNL